MVKNFSYICKIKYQLSFFFDKRWLKNFKEI